MPQTIVFLTDEENEKVLSLMKRMELPSKHEAIKYIINEFTKMGDMQ